MWFGWRNAHRKPAKGHNVGVSQCWRSFFFRSFSVFPLFLLAQRISYGSCRWDDASSAALPQSLSPGEGGSTSPPSPWDRLEPWNQRTTKLQQHKQKATICGHRGQRHSLLSRLSRFCFSIAPVVTFIRTRAGGINLQSLVPPKWTRQQGYDYRAAGLVVCVFICTTTLSCRIHDLYCNQSLRGNQNVLVWLLDTFYIICVI